MTDLDRAIATLRQTVTLETVSLFEQDTIIKAFLAAYDDHTARMAPLLTALADLAEAAKYEAMSRYKSV